MYRGEEIIAFTEKNKPIIWGLFLSTIIFKHAVGNICFAILGAFFLLQVIQNRRINLKRSLLPMIIYCFLGIASLLWTTNISKTVSGLGPSLPLIALPLFISQYSEFTIGELKKTVRTFGIFLLSYFALCLVDATQLFFADEEYIHFFYHNLVSVFDNNAIYISLAVASCILVNFLLPKKSALDYLITFFLAAFLLLLSSKNIILTTCLLISLSMVVNRNKLRFVFIISFIVSIVALLIVVTDNPIKQRFLTELNLNAPHIWYGQDFYYYKFSGLEVRVFQWRIMVEMIGNNQIGILGLGLHNVNYLLEQYFSYYNLYKGYFYINFHNQFLQTLGELGFIGLIIFLGIFVKALYQAFKFKNKYQLLLMVLFIAAFFTESFLSRQKGVYLFATIYILVSMLSINANREKELKIKGKEII